MEESRWTGNVHDNRVWSNSEIHLVRDKYFDQKEYLLGDSAFSTWFQLQEWSQQQSE